MEQFNIYKDMKERTNGEFHLGIVGPVRTGKSTFIRKFMELLVLPKMEQYEREQAMDEMPISGKGKTITTVERNSIPKQVSIFPLWQEQMKRRHQTKRMKFNFMCA